MKIQNINSVNFGRHYITSKVESGEEDFSRLSDSTRLLVIYDMLKEQKDILRSLSDKQSDRQDVMVTNLKKISANQQKMNNFNKHAFDVILCSGPSSTARGDALENINYQYNRNKLDTVG